MKATVTFQIDTDALHCLRDDYLAALWHVAQANPAPIEQDAPGQLAEHIGREIIRRWLAATPPLLWEHQGAHAEFCRRLAQEARA